MKGADPQPEYYIDKIVQLTAVSYIHVLSLVNMWKFVAKRQKWLDATSVLTSQFSELTIKHVHV